MYSCNVPSININFAVATDVDWHELHIPMFFFRVREIEDVWEMRWGVVYIWGDGVVGFMRRCDELCIMTGCKNLYTVNTTYMVFKGKKLCDIGGDV